MRLELKFVGFRFLLTIPIFDLSAVVFRDNHKDTLSALFVAEDVLVEVADCGVFGRKENPFRLVRDPPECVSKLIV